MRNKGKSLVLMLMLSMAIAGCSNQDKVTQAKGTEAVPVQVQQVIEGTISEQAGIVGKFAPNESAQIAPKVNGKIGAIHVKLGQWVNKGDVLFTLDPTDLQNAVKQSQAAYQVAMANLKQAQNSSVQGIEQAQSTLVQMDNSIVQAENAMAQAEQAYRDAELHAQRTKQLFDAGAVSAVEWEKSQTALKNAQLALNNAEASKRNAEASYANARNSVKHAQQKSAVAVAQASVAQAKVNLENAQDQLNHSTVRASISGMISNVNGSTGQMASPQTPVVTIVNIDPILVKANLSEMEVTQVQIGAPVTVEVPAVNKKIEAKVSAISPVMDTQLKAYPMEISIPNPKREWKSDMVVNIHFKQLGGNQVKKIIIPRKAVFEEQGKKFVYKLAGDTAKKTEVTTGEETSQEIEIKSGLSVKDRVIVKGQTLLKDGSKVKLQNEE